MWTCSLIPININTDEHASEHVPTFVNFLLQLIRFFSLVFSCLSWCRYICFISVESYPNTRVGVGVCASCCDSLIYFYSDVCMLFFVLCLCFGFYCIVILVSIVMLYFHKFSFFKYRWEHFCFMFSFSHYFLFIPACLLFCCLVVFHFLHLIFYTLHKFDLESFSEKLHISTITYIYINMYVHTTQNTINSFPKSFDNADIIARSKSQQREIFQQKKNIHFLIKCIGLLKV